MAKDWQKMLDDFSGSNKSTTSSKPSTSSRPSSSSKPNATQSQSNDWRSVLDDFSGSTKSANYQKYADYSNSVAQRVITRAKKKKEEEEEKRGWLQKGALEDGITVGSISKAILGTISDAAEDFTTGFVGAPEAIWKGIARIAPDIADAQFYQNGAIYDLETEKAHKEAIEQSRKQMNEYANRDYYDQKNIARHILSSLSAGAYLSNNAEVGKMVTAEDLALSRELQVASRNYLDNEMESQSVFGEKVDSTVESLGQNAFTKALGGVGVPWQVTTGLSVIGSESQQAQEDGATEEEAKASALISAGGEILSEYLFGGMFGEVGLDDKFIKDFSRTVSNKFFRNLLKAGVKSTGEGIEEAFSFGVGTLGKYLTYADEKTLKELFTSEEALDELATNFVSGMLSGGVFNTADAIATNASGVDYTTGLTKNEQKVVDKVYKDRVAEEAKKGKVTEKQKSEIYDKVLSDMDKGYISTDAIEEALGGEKYNQYKQASEWEKSLQKEYDTLSKEYDDLYNMKNGDKSSKQTDREAELKSLLPDLKKKLDNVKATSTLEQMKSQIGTEVSELVKGDRLVESYNERERAKQDFVAEYDKFKGSKFEDAAKKTLDNATKAGANNTNRVRDFVEFVAKTSGDTGLSFDFKSGEQIKEDFIERQTSEIQKIEDSIKQLEKQNLLKPEPSNTELIKEQRKKLAKLEDLLAKVKSGDTKVNGNITDNGIVLNLDSEKPLNRIIGHEVTHSFETGKNYDALKETLYSYAKTKGVDIDAEIESRKLMYEGVEGADAEAELVADLVGDYLFSDQDYINNLATQNRNVFQKLWDEVKHLCKLATAGSKEARELERVRKAFEDAYREGGKAQSETKHSLSSMANTFFGDENMSSAEFMKKDYRETQGYKDYVDQCLNNYSQTRKDFDADVARKEIEGQIEGIVKVAIAAKAAGYDILDDKSKRDTKDSKKRLLFSSLEPNSDYITSHDISTICDKRKNFADIYDDIVKAEEAKGVPQNKRFFSNVDNYFYLHKLMADKGLTQPCRQCYVESMRKNLAPMANAFLRLVGEQNPNNTANDQLYHQKGKNKGELKTNNASTREWVQAQLADYGMSVNDLTVETLTTEDGLARLKIQAPLIYEAFNSFYGQSKPKMPKSATPFRFGELTALLTDEKGRIKKSVVDKINSTGGFRLQSYSDFQIQNYTDVLQVLFEAGTLGLNGHAYTKVPAFLDATEGTNLKRNISIFMYKDGNEWKLDRNDSFPYELEEIYDIVKADKSGNTGIIAVSQNADMSAWIMANDLVGYGIPFHKSGLKMGTVRDTIVREGGREIKGYTGTKDHTKQQTEVWKETTADHKKETKVKKGINIYSFWDFDNKSNLSKNELIEKNVKAYIDACEDAGYLPKFREYVMNNGKVLADVLKYSKELGYAAKDATINDISFEYKGYRIPYGYYKFLGDFGMFNSDNQAAPQSTLSLKDYDFDKATRFFYDSENLRRNEILQQFSNGEERQRYRDSDLTAEQLSDIIKQKRKEVAEGVVTRNSLTNGSEQFAPTSNFDVYGSDFRKKQEASDDIAPVAEESSVVAENATTVSEMENVAPVTAEENPSQNDEAIRKAQYQDRERRNNVQRRNSVYSELQSAKSEQKNLQRRIEKTEAKLRETGKGSTARLDRLKTQLEQQINLVNQLQSQYDYFVEDYDKTVEQAIETQEALFEQAKQEAVDAIDAYNAGQITKEQFDAAQQKYHNAGMEVYRLKHMTQEEYAQELASVGLIADRENMPSVIPEPVSEQNEIAPTPADTTNPAVQTQPVQEAPQAKPEVADDIAPVAKTATVEENVPSKQTPVQEETPKKQTRKEYHQGIIDNIKERFDEKGFDFDKVLKDAKNLSTWSTVDNTPQRVMEKALGYKQGGILADITVNKVAQNETEGIKWVNKNVALLKQISKDYNIKPGSKKSAAAQMYAEGFYVDKDNNIVQYGDRELAIDFPDPKVRENIKGLARDPRIRKIYDDALGMINESRTRNLYPEIPRLDNYFLHFRAMEDTFSTLGLPFNPNDIKAKDLPTDLNGVTADLKPGQPYFASAMHREGKRTSFDMLGGIERYLTSAKNQIYHIDDIQTLRALRNYIAETYGQAKGLEDLDSLSDAEAEERIKQVYGSHLSTFAKFLNEEANVLAGKTALIDRGFEGIIGRRGITFLNTLNRQVGSNMVGYNISSSLTNFLPVAQTFAKTNKFDFMKALAQTAANKLSRGKFDSFAEDSPVVIRRKGEDRFYQTPWQKASNPGYVLMGMVDDVSTEIIARTKYNELTRKGMDSQKAHFETDKWVSRLMGDRSLGQQPQLYNSKMLGLITKFQLEVRNQLDSQFYDTIQETKVSNEAIQNGLARNAKTAAQVASTFTQLAVAQHLFGIAFESVAGYNPAFDIIEVLTTAFGFDDEEEDEDTALDNIEQGFLALLEDMPYASTFLDGGRIPISEALPINEFVQGKDQYGNDKSRWKTAAEVAPYYFMPAGYGQYKKTKAGLNMFSDEHPIAGSYTDAGNLRFPVEDTLGNRIHAGIFGQYASKSARQYFDEEQKTLNPDQTEILAGMDIPVEEYWEYRDELNKFKEVKDQMYEAANADGATEEDVLMNKYFNSVNSDLNNLYNQQKEIAEGNSPDKQAKLRELQDQMSDILADSEYESDIPVSVSGAYAEVGNRRYNYDAKKDTWYEIKSKTSDGEDNWYYIQEKLSHDKLGISYSDFWNDRRTPSKNATYYAEYNGKRYNYDAEKSQWYEIRQKNDDGSDNWFYQKEQEVTKSLGISYEEYWSKPKEYNYAHDNPGKYAISQTVGGYDSYMEYKDALENWQSDNYISADKDSKGNTISGSRKKKVVEYINGLDLDDGEKIILYRSVYSSKADKRTYDKEIVNYLNSRNDLPYKYKKAVLEELDFEFDSKGKIKW